MKILGGAAALLFAASALAQGSVAPEELFERLAPSVWTVHAFDASGKRIAGGSGVVVGPGSVVTNCHVLAKASRVTVGRENVSYGASLEHPDAERDLCLLKVANFTAPAVTVAPADGMKIGSRVYAIGSPRGLEQTISDGLLSGVRRTSGGDFTALQVTVPISRGSSGGGLFDAHGRLIGITTFQLRDGQNLNFALPAQWIQEVPQRAQAALAQARTAAPLPGTAAAVAAAGGRQVYEYELRDRLTGSVQKVVYRLDRREGDRLVFNDGSRIESASGGVLHITSRIGGEFDHAMPPGGWIQGDPRPGAGWHAKFERGGAGAFVGLDVRARVLGESTMRLKERALTVVQVEFTGFTSRSNAHANPPGSYRASAWYAPELGRIVRFEVQTRGGGGGTAFYIDEQLQLVDIRSE